MNGGGGAGGSGLLELLGKIPGLGFLGGSENRAAKPPGASTSVSDLPMRTTFGGLTIPELIAGVEPGKTKIAPASESTLRGLTEIADSIDRKMDRGIGSMGRGSTAEPSTATGGGGILGTLSKLPGLGFLKPSAPSMGTSVDLSGYYSGITGGGGGAAVPDFSASPSGEPMSGMSSPAEAAAAAGDGGGGDALSRLLLGGGAMASAAAAAAAGGRASPGAIAGKVEPLAQKTASSLIPGGLFGHSGFGTTGAGPAASGLAFSGGMMLMADTLRRGTGGVGGAIEGGIGGAAMGFSVAGPIGAAVGAGVGALIGALYQNTDQQIIDKVKAKYGVSITKSTAEQINQMAKQSFGGSVDAAIASPQTEDMLNLVAQATGQKYFDPNKVRPLTAVESGGKIYQQALYENGQPLSFQGSMPVYQGVPTTAIPSSPEGFIPNQFHFMLDPSQTLQFLTGQAIQAIASNPRSVTSALSAGLATNVGRGPLRSAIGATGEVLM